MKYWKITYKNYKSPSGRSVCYKYARDKKEAVGYFKKIHGHKDIISINDE